MIIRKTIIFFYFILLARFNIYSQQDTSILYPVRHYVGWNLLSGYVNSTSKLVVPFIYKEADYFKDGLAIVRRDSGANGAINNKGQEVIPSIYDELKIGGKYVFIGKKSHDDSSFVINLNGEVLYACKCQIMRNDKLGFSLITYKKKQGEFYEVKVLDSSFKQILLVRDINKLNFEVDEYSNILKVLRNNSYATFYDFYGNKIFDSLSDFTHNQDKQVLIRKYSFERKSETVAIIDSNYRFIIPFDSGFQQINFLWKLPYIMIQKNNKWAIYDKKFNQIVPFVISNEFVDVSDSLYEIRHSGNSKKTIYKYYNFNNILQFSTDEEIEFRWRKLPYTVHLANDKYILWNGGFISDTFDYISLISADGYAVYTQGSKSGLIDSNGKVILNTNYRDVSMPINGFIGVSIYEKCIGCDKYTEPIKFKDKNDTSILQFGFINLKGEKLNDEKYDFIYPFNTAYSYATKSGKLVFINKDGKVITQKSGYSILSKIENGLVIIKDSVGRVALMDGNLKIISEWVSYLALKERTDPNKYFFEAVERWGKGRMPERVASFNKGLIVFGENKLFGLMDTLGNIVVKPIYSDISYSDNHFRITILDNNLERKLGLLDSAGNIILEPVYENLEYHYGNGSSYYELWTNKDTFPQIFIHK